MRGAGGGCTGVGPGDTSQGCTGVGVGIIDESLGGAGVGRGAGLGELDSGAYLDSEISFISGDGGTTAFTDKLRLASCSKKLQEHIGHTSASNISSYLHCGHTFLTGCGLIRGLGGGGGTGVTGTSRSGFTEGAGFNDMRSEASGKLQLMQLFAPRTLSLPQFLQIISKKR